MKPASTTVQVLDLFCGCGGLSFGFTEARSDHLRFDVLGGIDLDDAALATYRHMLRLPGVNRDVCALLDGEQRSQLADELGYDVATPLVVIGGPPCQGFSSHRKKDPRRDDRNSLIEVFAEIASAYHPEFIVMENVPEIFDSRHWHHFQAARELLEQRGYRVRARVYNLADFGVPQARFRSLMLARRAARPFDMPTGSLDATRHRTVRDAIGSLPAIRAGESDRVDAMHVAPNHTDRILRLIASVPRDGGSRAAARHDLLPRCHGEVDGFRDVYGRLAWDKPSISITGKSSTPSSGRFLHPEQNRNISVREAALLQGFPAHFEFCGPFVEKYRQIGNAVPPVFSRQVAEHLLKQLASTSCTDDPADDIAGPLKKSFSSSIAGLKKNGNGSHRAGRSSGATVVGDVPYRPVDRALTTIDCFCGAGGLSYGLHRAGFRTVYAFDNDPYAVATYRNNVAACVEQRSAEAVSPDYVLERAGLRRGDCTLVVGGPPCQGFSQQRRGPDDDPRNSLVAWYAAFVLGIQPVFFVLENVTYLAAKRGKAVFTGFLEAMKAGGYAVQHAELDASDFGVPQRRRRILVVGYRPYAGLHLDFSMLPHRTQTTVRDGIFDLPSPPEDGDVEHPDFANHKRAKITEINLRRIACVPQGGGWQDIPEELQLACHQRHRGQGHVDVFGRLAWDTQARTITALCDNFSRGQFAHPEEHRSITGREAASLQSFPRSYRFWGPKKDVARQVGNAVPPLLAEALGCAIKEAITRWQGSGASRRLLPSTPGEQTVQPSLL